MKKNILILFALIMGITSATAQCALPTSAEATVTFKRIIPGLLDGNFTIGLTGEKNPIKVQFSQGNLQYKATAAGTSDDPKWRFAEHQYDYIGAAAGNTAPSASQTAWIDLFGWATSGNSASGTSYQPWETQTSSNDYYGSSKNSAGEWTAANSDWGVVNARQLGDGWRTLTNPEWSYLIQTRNPKNRVNNTTSARWTEATINTDGTSVNGLILFPDDANLTTVTGVTWGTINGASNWGTKCTTAGWTALEEAGCVFLPSAGFRNGTTVKLCGVYCAYWSSTASSAVNAFSIQFGANAMYTTYNDPRSQGASVRLVRDVIE